MPMSHLQQLEEPPEEVAAEPTASKGPTPEQQTALRAAIANAQTLAEVQRLEDALRSGQVLPLPALPSSLRMILLFKNTKRR